MHLRIDNVIMNKWDLHKIIKCEIGAADISNLFSIQVKLNLNSRRNNTIQKLNIGILNKKEVKEQIKQYIEKNDNEGMSPIDLWDACKVVIRGKLIAVASKYYQRKRVLNLNLVGKLKILKIRCQATYLSIS